MPTDIRPATPADIPAITRIYGHAVPHGTASFELEPPGEAEMARRMQALIANDFPYLAAEMRRRPGRLCLCGRLSHAAGLSLDLEDSIYVAPRRASAAASAAHCWRP